jgi:hypothetical protein
VWETPEVAEWDGAEVDGWDALEVDAWDGAGVDVWDGAEVGGWPKLGVDWSVAREAGAKGLSSECSLARDLEPLLAML